MEQLILDKWYLPCYAFLQGEIVSIFKCNLGIVEIKLIHEFVHSLKSTTVIGINNFPGEDETRTGVLMFEDGVPKKEGWCRMRMLHNDKRANKALDKTVKIMHTFQV